MEHQGETITAYDVKHLPLITALAQKLGLVEEFDKQLKGSMEVSPGRLVLAMVIDALSGRSPLFKLHEFYETHDTELLLGEAIPPKKLSDWNLVRVLDRIFDYGTNKLLTAVVVKGLAQARITESLVHFDTTSVRVWGDFKPEEDDPFLLARGYSKDKRPNLNQFVLSLLTVKGGLPVRFTCENGNESDKTINTSVLENISNYFSTYGLPRMKAYVADSALVTKTNLELLEKVPFITRLPAVYGECGRAIREAVARDCWTDIGILAETGPHESRVPAQYHAGRPAKQGKRQPREIRYGIATVILPDEEAQARVTQEAGCFVLLVHKIPLVGRFAT
jgi:transposase